MSDDRDDTARQAAGDELAVAILHTIIRNFLEASRVHGETDEEAKQRLRYALGAVVLGLSRQGDPELPHAIETALLLL